MADLRPGDQVAAAIPCPEGVSQGKSRCAIDWDVPSFSVLATRNGNDPLGEIHVLHAKSILLTASHSSVQRQVKLRFQVGILRLKHFPQGLLLARHQESNDSVTKRAGLTLTLPLRFARE